MDSVFSDTRPTVRGSTEDVDEDDGLGNGEPPEIKEFIEEMGESGAADFMPPSSPSLMALPLMLLFGCLTVSTALWKDCAFMTDLILLNSPLGEIKMFVSIEMVVLSRADGNRSPQEGQCTPNTVGILYREILQL